MFDMSVKIDAIMPAMLKIQNKFLVIEKTGQGHMNKYAPYPELIKTAKPIFTEAGLLLFQPVTCLPDNEPAITTIILHAESCQWIKSVSPIKMMNSAKINEAQQVGGGISYMKRYALESMLAWATGDYDFDDDVIAKEDKKTAFMRKSFAELAESFNVEQGFKNEITNCLDIVTVYANRQGLYSLLRENILPIYEQDEEACLGLFRKSVRDLS